MAVPWHSAAGAGNLVLGQQPREISAPCVLSVGGRPRAGTGVGFGGAFRKSGSTNVELAELTQTGGVRCVRVLLAMIYDSGQLTRVPVCLPQVVARQTQSMEAHDVNGLRWLLVIRAWPNGGNIKPVYVLEVRAW